MNKEKINKILKQVQNDNVEEAGRSMVEMLGVLAVIGVLSVAGIAGYSIAMRSYRTNEIINEASKLYILAMAQNAGNGASGTSAVDYASVGGTDPSGATLSYNPTDKKITITFTDPNDCTMALNKLGDKASANTCSVTPATITVNFGEKTQNCWVTGTCGSGDADETYEEVCANGIVTRQGWCSCINEQTASGATEEFINNYCGSPNTDTYVECRSEGKSAGDCVCEEIDFSNEACERFQTCMSAYKTHTCCLDYATEIGTLNDCATP